MPGLTYRVSVNTKPSTVTELNSIAVTETPSSVYVLHRDWIRTAGEKAFLYLDPSIPDVRDWMIASIVAEVVEITRLTACTVDDYFYTEISALRSMTARPSRRYGQDSLPKLTGAAITQQLVPGFRGPSKEASLRLEFSLVLRACGAIRSHDPAGSDTRGAAAYDESRMQTPAVRFLIGLLDYVHPQLYWPLPRRSACYDVLAKWWADVVKSIAPASTVRCSAV